MSDEAKCYVVRSEHGAAAACVIDGTADRYVRNFLRRYGGKRRCEVMTVAEARALLIQHWHKKRYGLPIPDREPDGKFESMVTWVHKATSWIGGMNALCVDAKNRICRCGGDFQRAHDEGAFPVRFYFGAGGETEAEQRKSWARAKKALKLQYPWRDYR